MPETRKPQLDRQRRPLAATVSVFLPGSGRLGLLGQTPRGTGWLAGWVALVLVRAGHMISGLVLMAVSGFDALVDLAPRRRHAARPRGDGM